MNIPGAVWFVSVAALSGLSAGCRTASPSRPEGDRPGEVRSDPDQVLGRFTMDAFKGIERDWSLSAPEGRLFDRDQRVDLVQPRIRMYDKGLPGSEVTAAQGRLNTATEEFWAGGGVVVESPDGVRLDTDWARYEKSSDRFVSTAPVTVTRGRSIVRGVGWEAKSDMSDMTVFNQTVEIAPEDARRRTGGL